MDGDVWEGGGRGDLAPEAKNVWGGGRRKPLSSRAGPCRSLYIRVVVNRLIGKKFRVMANVKNMLFIANFLNAKVQIFFYPSFNTCVINVKSIIEKNRIFKAVLKNIKM